jgi:DNA-binding NarL/FixJ family response regulator
MVARGWSPRRPKEASDAMLTTRETDVLRLLSSGCSYKKISAQLGISLHTVGTHIKNTYRKLEVHSAAAAVMRAVQLGLLGQQS